MRNIVIVFSVILLLAGCSMNSRTESSWEYDILVTSTIKSKHVTYKNKILTIDGVEVPLPEGEKLYVKYESVNGRASSIVKVDNRVAEKRPAKQ